MSASGAIARGTKYEPTLATDFASESGEVERALNLAGDQVPEIADQALD